jgi:uncharacterized membrane protein YkoI
LRLETQIEEISPMKRSTQIILAVAFISTLGLGGLVKTVYARQPQSQVAIMPQHHSSNKVAQARERKVEQQATEEREGDSETNDDVNEQQEAAKLQSLAKISPQQAQRAAETAQGGKASSVKLENENGSLVYAVKIGQKEIKVDAGNGQVLYVENDNQENERNEASRPKSSIQVPNSNDERQTNDQGER